MANANVSAAVDALTALRGEAQGGVGLFSLPAAAVSFPYSKVDEPGQGRGKMVSSRSDRDSAELATRRTQAGSHTGA